MSRFAALDLARLPPLQLDPRAYEPVLAARLAELRDRLAARGIAWDVGSLETDPLVITEEHAAYREFYAYARRDEAIRAVMLATAWGGFLDHLGALFGVARKLLAEATAADAAVMEGDEEFRQRIALAPEAWSTCGSEGAYLYFALAVDGVKHAAVYGPMSTHTIAGVSQPVQVPVGHPRNSTGAPIAFPPGQVHVVIVSAAGNGAADAPLTAKVQAELSAAEKRPIADWLTVTSALITEYQITAVLRVGPGADPAVVKAAAETRLAAYTQRQHRAGAVVLRQAIAGACMLFDASGVPGADEAVIALPAADVIPGPYGAPFCAGITITVEQIDE